MSDVEWPDATFEVTSRAQRERWADASPQERLAAVESMLELALASGAIARLRAEKQRRVDALFAQ